MRSFSFRRCFGKGWDTFMRYPVPAIVGSLLVYVIIGAVEGAAWPFTGLLAIAFAPISFLIIGIISLCIVPQFQGGLAILALHAVNDNNPQITDIFKGFKKFGQFLVAYIFFSFMLGLIAGPVFVGVTGGLTTLLDILGGSFGLGDTAFLQIGLILAVIALGAGFLSLLLGWVFVCFIIADDWFNDGIGMAFNVSARMAAGNKVRLFLTMIILLIFTNLGLALFGVGIIITSMISMMVFASIYEELKSEETCAHARGWYENFGADVAVG